MASDEHRTRQALEHSSETLNGRSPLSMTISPPSSLTSKALKELIVSTDFGLPPSLSTSRQKRARSSRKDGDRCTKGAVTKAARTMAASPVRQLCNTIESKGNVAASTTKGKKCVEGGCTRRAQSNSRCKAHGGGARCQYAGPGGCARSSQGGGFCRAHGGGKRCEFPGCTRGQQRKGRCYVHGGIRKCQYGSCEKKDRGNGFCIAHGGGKRCEHANCSRAVRRGLLCQIHETQQVALVTERQQRESVLV
uniref:WRKY transcription factor 19 n=1 Tax=Peronospora matthiolae TaxID=2874970 RepID=A0AAV1TSC6_9STRA